MRHFATTRGCGVNSLLRVFPPTLSTIVMSTSPSTNSRTQYKPEVERYRLPVKFEGELVIHSIGSGEDAAGTDSDDEEPSTQVEERWIPTRTIGQGRFGEVWLQKRVGEGQLRAVKRLPQVSRAVDFSRELGTLAALVDVWLLPFYFGLMH